MINTTESLDKINFLTGQISQLRKNAENADESARMEEDKSRLFAEISHELRTPNGCSGFVGRSATAWCRMKLYKKPMRFTHKPYISAGLWMTS